MNKSTFIYSCENTLTIELCEDILQLLSKNTCDNIMRDHTRIYNTLLNVLRISLSKYKMRIMSDVIITKYSNDGYYYSLISANKPIVTFHTMNYKRTPTAFLQFIFFLKDVDDILFDDIKPRAGMLIMCPTNILYSMPQFDESTIIYGIMHSE